MLDLINASSSYNFKKANNLRQSLVFYKNILMLMSKKGFRQHSDNVVFPIRWSRQKDTWVVDFRTQKKRDIEGIELNNLEQFYSKDSTTYKLIFGLLNIFKSSTNSKFWNKLNIKKNETKFIAITCNTDVENYIFHVEGIYSFAVYKSRPGVMSRNNCRAVLIENSIETLTSISKVLNSNILKPHETFKNKSYYNEYEKFMTMLLGQKYTFTVDNIRLDFNMHDYLNTKYKKVYSYNEVTKIYCLKHKLKSIEFEGIIPYIIHDKFYSFLTKEFNLSSNIFIYDKLIEKNIKVSNLSYNSPKKDKEVNDQNNTLLLPMVY
jgi:hypothetical protein